MDQALEFFRFFKVKSLENNRKRESSAAENTTPKKPKTSCKLQLVISGKLPFYLYRTKAPFFFNHNETSKISKSCR